MQSIKIPATISDAEIINRIQEGEIQLYEIFIRRNNPLLYKVGMSYGYNRQDVEDLMQETFIAAYLNLGKFENRSTFKTWIIRIMLNQCYQKAQKLSFKNEKNIDAIFNENTTPMFENTQSTDSLKIVLNKELGHIVENALTRIPIDYRLVFSLRELNGMNTAETADVLGISQANVKVRLNRARYMLRKIVEKIYSPEDIFEFNLIYCDNMVSKVMEAVNEL